MNKEPTKIMEPCQIIPPPLASELNNKTHHSRDTQFETQPKKRSLKLNDGCQGNETKNTHTELQQSLLCSETCESFPQEAAALEEETLPPSAEEITEAAKELMSEGLPAEEEEEDSGRERLKKHRMEVAGSVWIPDIWGQEEMLKDCSAFDASLVPSGIISARAALVQEGRRANSGGLRLENSC